MLLLGTIEDRNYSFSVDKVIPNLGYTKGNIVFCINIVNTFKSSLLIEQFRNILPKNIKEKYDH